MGKKDAARSTTVPALTGIRGLAAGLVLFHHAHAWIPDPDFSIVHGSLGVIVFFVLSGYLITKTYAPRFAAGYDLRTYFIRRWARIFPLYLLLWAIKTTWAGEWGYLTWDVLLGNLTLMQGYFYPHIIKGLAPIAWSLTVEESFYVLAPFLFWVLNRKLRLKKAPAVALLLIFLSVGIYQVGYALHGLNLDPFLPTISVLNFSIFWDFQYFAAGIFFAWLPASASRLSHRQKDLAFASSALLAWFCLAALGWNAGKLGQDWGGDGDLGSLLVIAFTAAVAAAIWAAGTGSQLADRIVGNRPIVYLGKISYATYLLNTEFLFRKIHSGIESLLPSAAGSTLVFGAILLAISALLYEAFERPAHAWILAIADRSGKLPRRARGKRGRRSALAQPRATS